MIDDAIPWSASKIASGIINPLTGRRIVKTWMIDDLMPFAWKTYTELSTALGINGIAETSVTDFFPTPQMRLAYLNRYEEDQQYLSLSNDGKEWNSFFNNDFGYATIQPCYLVNMHELLQAFRLRLIAHNQLMQEDFQKDELILHEDGVVYKSVTAGKIIFCDGISAINSIYFKNLPFAANKGEALIAEINNLPPKNIFKKGLSIVPWRDGLFWIGSSYEWQFTNDRPTISFRERTTAQLKSFCKMPFTIIDHWAAVRPATLERRPFAGTHPLYPRIAILNGMGTKGCSLAPYFANQLALNLTQQIPVLPEADVQRFRKVLQRATR